MAHGDYRIEIKLSVLAPAAELARAHILANVADKVAELRAEMMAAAGAEVSVEAKSVRENAGRPKAPPAAGPRLAGYGDAAE